MVDPNVMTQIKYVDSMIGHHDAIRVYLNGRLWEWIDLATDNGSNAQMLRLIYDSLGPHCYETKRKIRKMIADAL